MISGYPDIRQLPKHIRCSIIMFTCCLSIGYFTGFKLTYETTSLSAKGIEENYLGNENDEEALIMKFKKSEKEILVTIHSHIVSFSLIFFSISLILATTPLPKGLLTFLMIEPFVSTVVTFGSIWLIWKGLLFFKYIAMLSGILLTLTFVTSVIAILFYAFRRQFTTSSEAN